MSKTKSRSKSKKATPASSTQTASSSEAVPIAGLMRRLAAMVYDGLVMMAVLMAYGAIALTVKYQLLQFPYESGDKMELGPVGFALMLVVVVLFNAFFWRRGGQTVGMKAWRLKVVDNEGNTPSWAQCVKRCVFAWLSFALGGLGYWWCLIDGNSMSAHDHLSGTQVVVLPKPKAKPKKLPKLMK